MRKLIRDKVTKRLLMEDGQWTSQESLADDFYLNNKAPRLEGKCNENLEWLYAFDFSDTSEFDFALKMY